MSFTTLELQRAGKVALNHYLRNEPIDQVAVERPWLAKLMSRKRAFPGGKQYVVEQLRYRYQSNFQWYYGDQQVSYNKRATIEQAQFTWTSCHDGYSLNEDDFFQNGITIADSAPRMNTEFEREQLTNLYEENNAALRMGFEEQLSRALHVDGTQDDEAIEGLDVLVSTTPASGTVGGIAASNAWWQNYASTGIAQASLVAEMEIAWRKCIRNGGLPDFIMMGSDALDTFREATKSESARYVDVGLNAGQASMDPSIGPVEGVRTGLAFQRVPIIWNPEFEDLDSAYPSASPDWEKRIYFINCRYIKLRPAKGHDMVTRTPPRVYDRYAYYFGLTWKGALTCGRRNAHAVLSVA